MAKAQVKKKKKKKTICPPTTHTHTHTHTQMEESTKAGNKITRETHNVNSSYQPPARASVSLIVPLSMEKALLIHSAQMNPELLIMAAFLIFTMCLLERCRA